MSGLRTDLQPRSLPPPPCAGVGGCSVRRAGTWVGQHVDVHARVETEGKAVGSETVALLQQEDPETHTQHKSDEGEEETKRTCGR